MKKTLLSLFALSTLGLSLAQAQSTPEKRFNVTYTTGGTYTPLSNSATEVGFPLDWDDEISDPINLPFTFSYQNVLVEDIIIETYGSLILNGEVNEDLELGHITGLNMDYASAGRGKVKYEKTGTAGNQIFKVEYQNVGRFQDTLNVDTLNFQIWLYENGNIIEYRAGYGNVANDKFANTVAESLNGREALLAAVLFNEGNVISTATESLFVHAGTPKSGAFKDSVFTTAEVVGANIPALDALMFGAYPPNGSVIRYAPKTSTGIAKIDFDMAAVFPNPSVDGNFTLRMKETPVKGAKVHIFDMSGKIVSTLDLQQAEIKIELSHLSSGQYFGHIVNGSRQGVFKVTKQ